MSAELFYLTSLSRSNRVSTNYQYDNLSRLLSVLHHVGGTTLDGSADTLDSAGNRLSRADALSGITPSYTYDGDGKRVKKGTSTLYWYGASAVPVAETDSSGNSPVEYIFFGGARIARRDASGNVTYYFWDQVGSTRTITDATGHLCYDADFYPFGGERTPYVNTCAQSYKFSGMERDSETQNDHTMFRYYESNLGRWLSPDPLAGDVTNPQSLNRYAYVMNSPCSYTDPLGLDPCGFNIAINNSGLINQSQLSTLEQALKGVFATAGVGVSFNFSGAADYSLDVTTSAAGLGYHQSVPGLIEGSPQDPNAGGETPGFGNYIANFGMVYVDRFLTSGYNTTGSLATALGWAGAHEAGHYLLHIGDSPRNMGVMAPTLNGSNWWPGFTGGQAILLQDKCNKLHPPGGQPIRPGWGGAGGGGGGQSGHFHVYAPAYPDTGGGGGRTSDPTGSATSTIIGWWPL